MNRIEIVYQNWKGSSEADTSDPESIMLVRRVFINGERVYFTRVSIGFDGDKLRFVNGEMLEHDADFLVVSLEGMPQEQRDRFGPERWLEGSDEKTLLIPASSIEFVPLREASHLGV